MHRLRVYQRSLINYNLKCLGLYHAVYVFAMSVTDLPFEATNYITLCMVVHRHLRTFVYCLSCAQTPCLAISKPYLGQDRTLGRSFEHLANELYYTW